MDPEMISDKDIARMAALPKLCPHFHLSLQSGCDRTLRDMNRHYDTAKYLELCEKLRTAFPGCAITTDIMVGFPGETEQDFAESLAFAERVGFAQAHIFPYSRRSGTKADTMPGQLTKSEKSVRAAAMAKVCKGTALRYNESFVGRTVEVLFEREGDKPYHTGHSREYIEVRVPRSDNETWRRQIKQIRITGAESDHCTGEEVL
jgi:threonylcarbamoyladenosine tRNA methylthiotransferase MtaB